MGEILQEGPSGIRGGKGASITRRFTCIFCSCPGLVVKRWHRAGFISIHFHPWVGKSPWRKAQQPTPVSLPGESHGQWSLVGYSPQGHKELDTTEST